MNVSARILVVMFVLFVQLSQEGVIKVSHKKPIKIKIQAKPAVLIKKPLPLLLLKKPLSLLLLKRYNSKFRKGWPLSALFTFKAVKYAKLAFLTSLVKKRRRRSLADSTLFSAPSIQVWLNDQRRLAGRYTKSNGNRQSSRVFRLDLRTYGTVPKSPTLKTEPYVLSDDATTKAPYTSNFVSTKLADSEPTTGSLTEPGPTTWSPSLQGYVDDCSSPVNALRRDHPNHFAKNTTIFFSMRSEAEERFLREIISGRNHVSSSKTNITTATSITDESGDDWSDNTSATREISQQIDETTTDHTEFRFTLPESTSNAKTSAKHGQLVDGISQQEHQRQFTTETAFMFHETSESDFVESFEEQKTTFNERGVSEKVKILPASDNFELSSHSTTEINESSFDYSVSTLLSEIPTKTIHRPVENMTDWPVVSIVTSVSELITTKKEEKLPIAFVDHNDITTTESAATKQTVINPSPVISVKTVLRNIAKLPPEHAHAIQFDSSSSMVSPGYVAKNQNSSAGHPIRPIIIGSFEFSFDSNNDAKQRSNRPKAFTKNDAVAVKRQYASQSQVFYEKEGSLERITDTRDIGQNHTSKTISFLTTEHVLQATTSASNLHALSSTLPSITTPMPGLKPAILKADVTKALHEVRAFDDSDESNKSIERLTVKHNKKPLSDSPTQIRTQTSISLNELGEPFNPETRVVYDSKMTPTVEEVKTVKKKQTFLIGHTWTGNKNTSKKNKETISNSPTQRPMEEAFTKVNKVSSKPTSNLASHENHNDDVNEIFKSLRENDQDGCIQRAICEYEAMKRTKTLNIMEESFVDLFGSNVPQPSEKDRHKDSYPFHRAAFIGDNFRNVALCTSAYRLCSKLSASLLSAVAQKERPLTADSDAEPFTEISTPKERNEHSSSLPLNTQNMTPNNAWSLIPSIFPPAIPPNVRVRPGSKATQFSDGTLLIVEPPAEDIPGIPIISHLKLSPPPLLARLPEQDVDGQHIPIKEVILPPHPHAPAIFETEVSFSTGGNGLNEILQKIPKVLNNSMKLAPQMVDLLSHLIKHDIRKSPVDKHSDFIYDIIKGSLISHIQRQFHRPSVIVNSSKGDKQYSLPFTPTVRLPPNSTHSLTFPVAPPAIPRTTARPSSPTPVTKPLSCSTACCNCRPQFVKHFHNYFDKPTITTRKPQKKMVYKKEPFLVIEKEPFRLEIGR